MTDNLYAAHFLGANGQCVHCRVPDDTPMSAAVDPGTMRANPHLQGMTVADFKQCAH